MRAHVRIAEDPTSQSKEGLTSCEALKMIFNVVCQNKGQDLLTGILMKQFAY